MEVLHTHDLIFDWIPSYRRKNFYWLGEKRGGEWQSERWTLEKTLEADINSIFDAVEKSNEAKRKRWSMRFDFV